MKSLIVYYSHTGNNKILALHIQKKLDCEILRIEEARGRSGFAIFFDLVFNRTPKLRAHGIDLERYDHFILIGPIWAGRIASPLRSFIRNEKNYIKSYSFITFCGGGANGQLDKIRKEFKTILTLDPTVVEELWISNLPAKTGIVSNYRVTPEDLKYFEIKVNEFVRQHREIHEISVIRETKPQERSNG